MSADPFPFPLEVHDTQDGIIRIANHRDVIFGGRFAGSVTNSSWFCSWSCPPETRSPMPPIRQTQSYLRNLFTERGITPQRRLGQNFLIDLNIHELIVKASEAGSSDVILEVGSGTGALTSLLAGLAAAVVAVDVDPAMAKLTVEAVAGLPNVRVLTLDALQNKNTMNPELLDNVRAGLAGGIGKRFKVVANLPYQVATPVITNLLVHPELCPILMVVTIQREVAERLCAFRPARRMARSRSWFRHWPTCRSCDRCLRRFFGRAQGRLGRGRHPAQCRQASRRGRCRLVSRFRAPGVPPPAQVSPAWAGRDLA